MKYPDFFKEDNRDAAAFTLRDLCTKFCKKSFYVAPLNVRTCRASEDQFKGALVLSLHA